MTSTSGSGERETVPGQVRESPGNDVCVLMVGLDTSFFFSFKAGHDPAVNVYADIAEHGRGAAVSTVTVFELLRHGYVGRLDRDFAKETAERVGVAFHRAGTDEHEVLRRAARIAHGVGLPMADAMIAASLEKAGCGQLFTNDRDFERYQGPMEVVFL